MKARLRNWLAGIGVLVSFVGCGTVQEGTSEDEMWDGSVSISQSALLEYRIDSLTQENRKLQQQLENTAAENRNLAARAAELEGKVGSGSVAPSSGGLSSGTATTSAPNPAYESALRKFRSKRYQESIDEFNALLSAGIGDDLSDNSIYWLGECYFALKRYDDAVQKFEAVTSIAGSDKADDAQLMLGNAYLALGNKAAAREALQTLISTYPASPLVKRARVKLSALQ